VLAHINYELLFWVDGTTNIVAALVMLMFLKPVNYKPPVKTKTEKLKTGSAYADSRYMLFIIVTVLFASCFFQLFTNIPVFFKKELHLSEPFIGMTMAANGIMIALIEMVLIYKLETRKKNMLFISIGVFIVGISFLMLNLPIAGAVVAFSMIIMITFGEMLAMPFMNSYWIARTQPSNRGQYAALYTMAWSLAQTIGPVGGAQLAQHRGFTILWWVIGGLAIVAALLFRRLHRVPVEA